eukprot:3705691-Pleurochrysis_carterae.AAC.3
MRWRAAVVLLLTAASVRHAHASGSVGQHAGREEVKISPLGQQVEGDSRDAATSQAVAADDPEAMRQTKQPDHNDDQGERSAGILSTEGEFGTERNGESSSSSEYRESVSSPDKRADETQAPQTSNPEVALAELRNQILGSRLQTPEQLLRRARSLRDGENGRKKPMHALALLRSIAAAHASTEQVPQTVSTSAALEAGQLLLRTASTARDVREAQQLFEQVR